jgi:vacuolar-type H+-ATPase subunit I/STV1
MIKNLQEAKASAEAAAAERDQSQQLLRAERLKHHEAEEAARAEAQAVYDAAVEDLRDRDNKITEQETTIRRLHRLIGEQQDQISRLQAEVGREQREKNGVQLVLRSVLPVNTSTPPLPTPDLEPLRELASPGSDQCDEEGRVRSFFELN